MQVSIIWYFPFERLRQEMFESLGAWVLAAIRQVTRLRSLQLPQRCNILLISSMLRQSYEHQVAGEWYEKQWIGLKTPLWVTAMGIKQLIRQSLYRKVKTNVQTAQQLFACKSYKICL